MAKYKPARERLHEARVRDLGCILCRLLGRGSALATLHHCRFPVGMGQRSSGWYAIPLARPLHQLGQMPPEWPFRDDVPIEAGEAPFRLRYGLWEPELLVATYQALGEDVPGEVQDELLRRQVA